MFRKCLVVVALCLLMPAAARAQEVPDLTGTWVMEENQAVIAGSGGQHNPQSESGIHYSTMTFTLEIAEQNGRVFHGSKISDAYTETIVGGVAYDGESLWFAEEEGIMQGRLVSPTVMELIYVHETDETDIVGVGRYVKQ